MPEGPEIRLAADKIADALVGRAALSVEFAFDRLQPFEKRLQGHRVRDIETRGKAILTHFDNGWSIYSHNQLYGRWMISRQGKQPNTTRQLRLAIHNRDYSARLYSASDIDVIATSELEKHPFLARLGPDILSAQLTADDVLARLQAAPYRRRQFAGLLLDQGFLAGLGNYLRAEILTAAGLHPLARPADCTPAELRKLATQIVRLTRRSYKTRGIINPPGLVKELKKLGYRTREQYRFNTYGRDGRPCHRCGESIEFNLAGGRKMFFCPNCQPSPQGSKAV